MYPFLFLTLPFVFAVLCRSFPFFYGKKIIMLLPLHPTLKFLELLFYNLLKWCQVIYIQFQWRRTSVFYQQNRSRFNAMSVNATQHTLKISLNSDQGRTSGAKFSGAASCRHLIILCSYCLENTRRPD